MALRPTILTAAVAAALILVAARCWAAAPDAETTGPRNDEEEVYKTIETPPKRFPKTTLQCIFFRTIHDWHAIDRYNLVVWAPSRKHPYHVELDRPCSGLRFADTIAFSSNLDGRLCAFGGDAVIVDHERCPIGAITKLTGGQLKALLAQEPGKKPKASDE